jgi:hypothetical protein
MRGQKNAGWSTVIAWGPAALVAAAMACTDETSTYTLHCGLEAPALSPTTADVGAQVVATSKPLTEVQDTVVSVGGTRATVLNLSRESCDECDSCREDNECTSCADCDECAADCTSCVQTVTFSVPNLPYGDYPVTVTNVHGTTAQATLTVAAQASDDTGDSGDATSDSGDSGE